MASRISRAALTAPASTAPIDVPPSQETAHAAESPRRARRPVVPAGDSGAGEGDAAGSASVASLIDALNQTTREVLADAAREDAERPAQSADQPLVAPVHYVGDTAAPPALPQPIDLSIHPAGSNTEDPSRGIPRGDVRPGKEITGGFADQAGLQYFALDGRELGVLVVDMLQSMADRIVNDLRFNEAITYPRVSVRTWVEVSGFAEDQNFTVDKIVPDGLAARAAGDPAIKNTTAEIAREVADEVVFVIVAEKREADANGEPVDPPDKIRQELGLQRPRKQIIRGPGNSQQFVDR